MGKAVTKKDAEQMLENALEIGARMLISGAEIRRVEDSIFRICTAYGSRFGLRQSFQRQNEQC